MIRCISFIQGKHYSKPNRQFGIIGSHLFIKEGDEEGVYLEWEMISALHDVLH